jgi:alginate O-acetyltransferase complex protein AlgI
MQFSSAGFIIFLPIAAIVYYAAPQKARSLWLLAASYFFYLCWSLPYTLLLMFVTVTAYLSGLILDKIRHSGANEKSLRFKKRLCVAVTVSISFAALLLFKYAGMILGTVSGILAFMGAPYAPPGFDIAVPVGISFYILQAVSYTVDVYRGDTPAQKNIVKFALFVSFFPFIISGPIQKSKDFLPQLENRHDFDYERVKKGLMLIVFGYFQKLVIADRAGIIVDKVYANPGSYCGSILLFATLLFIVQLYADFAGYSNIAIGIAETLGFRIGKNFNHPYFSKSVAEFWRRWHISLSSWFKEYLYFPLGGNRRGKLKKYRNVMIVFLISGLWHGASWSFVVWGFLHGFYQITGALLLPLRNRIASFLHFDRGSFFGRFVRIGINFTLVGFAWIFFRASSLPVAITVIKKMFTAFYPSVLVSGAIFTLGLNARNVALLFVSAAILICISLLGRKRDLRETICEKNIVVRWAVYIAFTLLILVFGMYGAGFNPQSFIYAQF